MTDVVVIGGGCAVLMATNRLTQRADVAVTMINPRPTFVWIAGEQLAPINVGFFGQCIGLGRCAATVQIASKDDPANRFYIGGLLAAMIKETAIKGLLKELAHEARQPGSYRWWLKDGKRQQLLRSSARRGTGHRRTDTGIASVTKSPDWEIRRTL